MKSRNHALALATAALVMTGCASSTKHASLAHPHIPAQDYDIDPAHGGVFFEITHLGLSKTSGNFDEFGGKIHADSENPSRSTVEFFAKIDSIDTGVPPRDEHLRNADFFDAAKYPELRFKSTSVVKTAKGYEVTGDLTMHGRTKSVTIPFTVTGPYTIQGYGDQPPRIGLNAEPITIRRSDFALGDTTPFPDGVMGVTDEVLVRISLEATPTGSGG